MSITLGRIDYRLLHGIVATMWAPQSGAQRVMVIDDKVANDPIIKESMRLGKPAGMACSIITLETAIKNFKAGKYDNHKVFVVTECLFLPASCGLESFQLLFSQSHSCQILLFSAQIYAHLIHFPDASHLIDVAENQSVS